MHAKDLDLYGEGPEEFANIETIPIAGYVIHPDFNDGTFENDFALIQLQSASKLYADHLVELDSDDLELVPGDDLVIFGFGTLAYGGSTPNVMQEATLDYVSNDECAAAYDFDGDFSPYLCAARAGIDTCQVNYFIVDMLTLSTHHSVANKHAH
jgi:trypsin